MKLYAHPISTTSRPVMLFIADHELPVEHHLVDLMTGAQQQPDYLAINPNGLVPVLEDGDFRLTECSAILKYLADKVGSDTYPQGLQQRARVNELMDWFNTNFYLAYGYNLVYPQIFPKYERRTEGAQEEMLSAGAEQSRRWLAVLDHHILGPSRTYLCGDDITLADYLGAGILTLGDTIGCRFDAYPNVSRWLATMRARPNWASVHGHFDGMCRGFGGRDYRTV